MTTNFFAFVVDNFKFCCRECDSGDQLEDLGEVTEFLLFEALETAAAFVLSLSGALCLSCSSSVTNKSVVMSVWFGFSW